MDTFGTIDFMGKDIGFEGVKFDRLAMSNPGEIYMISLFAEAQKIKAIRSIMSGGAKITCNATGVTVKRPSDTGYYAERSPGRLFPSEKGYQIHTHKLGYGLVHAMFLSRAIGFMPVVSEESLWQELKGERFTTPLLRSWMPHLEVKLREPSGDWGNETYLEEAYCFGCKCGVLNLSTKHLDKIVTDGLVEGDLKIVKE